MKKLILAAIVFGSTSLAATAGTFQFDPEQDGTFIDVDVANSQLFPNDPVNVRQYLGADLALNNGDEFEEEFTYNFSNTTGAPNEIYLPNILNFNFDLEGTIKNVTYGAGVPDLINSPGTFEDDMKAASFDLQFDNTASALTIDYMGTVIGVFDLFQSTVTDTVALDGSNTNVGFVMGFEFNEAWAALNMATINNVWRKKDGNLINIDAFDLFAAGSAGPNGTSTGVSGDANGTFVGLNVKDNGATFTASIPEPTSIAILGLGLLGLAGSRRKAK